MFHVSYTCGKVKGVIEDLVPNKIWIKKFTFREEQIPTTMSFTLTSQTLIGLSVNYNLAIFQEYDKLKEESGRIQNGEYIIRVRLPIGIYRIFLENKSTRSTQNFQTSLKSVSLTVLDVPIKVGDRVYVSQPIIVLSKQDPMELQILIRPVVLDEEMIRVAYGLIIGREFHSKEKVKESERRINFRNSFSNAILEKNVNAIISLFKDELLRDSDFLESMADLLQKATEMFHKANILVGNIALAIEQRSAKDVSHALIDALDYDPKKFVDLEKATQDAFVFITACKDKTRYLEELMKIADGGIKLSSSQKFHETKTEAMEKLGRYFYPFDDEEEAIFVKLEDFQRKLDSAVEEAQDKKMREINSVFALERVMMVGDVDKIQKFLKEHVNDLPKSEYDKAKDYVDSQRPKAVPPVVDPVIEKTVLIEKTFEKLKVHKYQEQMEQEARDKAKLEESARQETARILLEMENVKKEAEKLERLKLENQERLQREYEEKMKRDSDEKIRKEQEEIDEQEILRGAHEMAKMLDDERTARERLELEDKISKELENELALELEGKISWSDEQLIPEVHISPPLHKSKSTTELKTKESVLDRKASVPLVERSKLQISTKKSESPEDNTRLTTSLKTPVSVQSPPHSPRPSLSSKLPVVLDSLHKSVISLIRLSSVSNDPSFAIRRIHPFVDDVDVILDSLLDILESNRSLSYFLKVMVSPLEIAKKIDPKMMQEFFNHKSYRQYQKEQNKILNEVRFLIQFILHFGFHKSFFQNLINDTKYTSTVYTTASIARNVQFKDEMTITFDLLGQLKFKFDVFLEPEEIEQVAREKTPTLGPETPLTEPLSVSTKKTKKKKNHAVVLKNIKLSCGKVIEFYLQESQKRNIQDVASDHIVTTYVHDVINFIIMALKSGFKDDTSDLWTTLTIIVNSSPNKDSITKKLLIDTFHEIEKYEADSTTKVHVLFALAAKYETHYSS